MEEKMKKIVIFLLMCLFAISCSSLSGKKGISDKTMEGKYVKSTNTFTYKKDNLIFKDRVIEYQLVDKTGLLNGIYDFMYKNYGVNDSDKVGLKITGHFIDKTTFEITKISNYQIPKEKL